MLIWPSWQRPSDPLDPVQICLTGAQSKTRILTFSRLLGPDPHRKSAPIFFWVNIFCSVFFLLSNYVSETSKNEVFYFKFHLGNFGVPKTGQSRLFHFFPSILRLNSHIKYFDIKFLEKY